MLHDFQNSIAFWKVPRVLPFVLVRQSADEDEYESVVE
jgi:hypothetical protein